MQYCFILGHNPTLSIAEISQVLKEDFQVVESSTRVLIIESPKELDAEQLQGRLGGTIKIGQIISRINTNFNTNDTDIVREISDALVKIGETAKRVYFGFSLYSLEARDSVRRYQSQIKPLAMEAKKILKNLGLSSRWVSSREEILSSVIVQKNKLLTQGVEFCFLIGSKKNYLVKTLSCQEVEEYSYYDFGRPARSMKQGMLPPKLAKIMINLAHAPQGGVMLDPFCGVGTILQEAIKMGYRNLIGTDIDEGAIQRTITNINWLSDQQKINFSDFNLKIFPADARVLSQLLTPGSIDAIATEPYLGPIDKIKDERQLVKIISELSELYLATFRELKQVLKKDGRLVIIFPVFKEGAKLYYLPIMEEIRKHGWRVIGPLTDAFNQSSVIKLTERQSIIYSRPDQHVLREIFIFTL
ncbi:MAG: DNA methyltransferase [Candidatus Parcubacteria bacterium]|nr:DNA methyltransferase [Candidatus Parcubacteria bacterium]